MIIPAKERKQISFLGYSHFISVNYLWIAFVITYTAVSTKVVPQKRYSVRDNAEWSYGYKEFGVD